MTKVGLYCFESYGKSEKKKEDGSWFRPSSTSLALDLNFRVAFQSLMEFGADGWSFKFSPKSQAVKSWSFEL